MCVLVTLLATIHVACFPTRRTGGESEGGSLVPGPALPAHPPAARLPHWEGTDGLPERAAVSAASLPACLPAAASGLSLSLFLENGFMLVWSGEDMRCGGCVGCVFKWRRPPGLWLVASVEVELAVGRGWWRICCID
ncbi:uncharacterized protein BKA78DRAFT_301212 [Phyllosticta capitalensis]|uniref:uncharacterized protein n=1 Tax=Phyllosticta capitalensis TaxID=121624 RepID=UPI00312F6C44